ncbi:MAG: alanine--tRNA ligase [Candidatus Hydrogenedentes bacterium]|nr:alanine--tRNA ligase [Candidatus Hydrogenedentota bacterium]
MKSDELRSSFLDFFRKRDHVIERSDTIVPRNDPTLLFTSAGMVQFKPYYTGEVPVPYRRAATSQKCLRAGGKANDLDEVGKTSRHLTFFEMLGNFSFGDYFKREAIQWAWEFSTEFMKFPAESIWVSVYEDDDEAYEMWNTEMGVPASRLVRLGAKDNFWGPAGDTGACGPCSELLFDRGADIDPNADPDNDPKERFLEFWNLVFPQFDQQIDGSRPPLKNRGIDTGMGLERIAALLQGVETVFDTDGIFPIIERTMSLTKVAYKDNPVPYRVIADHTRALSFMISDGILPSNEGRGYVLRRLLRRAARFGRELGLERPFLHEVCHTVIDRMGHHYPELIEGRSQIQKVIHTEEERFASTLARGMDLLEDLFAKLDKQGGNTVPGEDLFRLYDTYGFPIDLANDIAEDRGYGLDHDGFKTSMSRQREQARSAWTGSGQEAIAPVYRKLHDELGETHFVGYDLTETTAVIQAIVVDGKRVREASEGQEAHFILNETPFYAESGGQVGDTGTFDAVDGNVQITDTKKPVGKMHVHSGKVLRGVMREGDRIEARIDAHRRANIINHHTATHLLQAAMRTILGDHVHQAGSLVAPDRLRFDFTHFESIPRERIEDIERMVNDRIREDEPISISHKKLDEARAAGAMALFGEKYEDTVRVVRVGDFSMELCGGCHVPRTGTIGYFKIVSESAVSSGVRRIEAVCGEPAVEAIQSRDRQLAHISHLLSAQADHVEERVRAVLEENRRLQREIQTWKQAAAMGGSVDYMNQIQEVGGIRLLAVQVDGQDAEGLRSLMDQLRDKIGSGVVVLGSGLEDKVALCVGVTKDLTGRVRAGDMVKQLAPIVGGGGGGRPDLAQAGGKNVEKLPECIAAAPAVLAKLAD